MSRAHPWLAPSYTDEELAMAGCFAVERKAPGPGGTLANVARETSRTGGVFIQDPVTGRLMGSEKGPGHGVDPTNPRMPQTSLLPKVKDGRPLRNWIETHCTERGAGSGVSDSTWYHDDKTGNDYLVKSGQFDHEGTNEMIGSAMLGQMDIVSSDVRVADDINSPYAQDGNFEVAIEHLDNNPGVDDATGDWNYNLTSSEAPDVVRMSMFDQVTQNQDGHPGNFSDCTKDGVDRLAPIDNSLILGGRGYGGFPDPAPMYEFQQPNADRQRLGRGIGQAEHVNVVPIYDQAVKELQRGVTVVNSPQFLDKLPSDQRDWVMNTAVPYMQRQVDGLTTFRDVNTRWLQDGSHP